MKTFVHQVNFPLPDGPEIGIATWYGGVSIDTMGQSRIKLGYRVKLDEKTVLETREGKEDYFISPRHTPESTNTLAHLIAYVTNDFILAEEIENQERRGKKGAERLALLKRYQELSGVFWDAVVARYGEAVCYDV
jgi:hypothetical protein